MKLTICGLKSECIAIRGVMLPVAGLGGGGKLLLLAGGGVEK